jgi:lipopolysaccharide transport system ATP-binding protein
MRPILEIKDVSKEYRLGQDNPATETFREFLVRQTLLPLRAFRRGRGDHGSATTEQRFWALRDVSFQVGKGEVVGIIGRNGAGKSTLLKIVSRITRPTNGTVTTRGRMAALLEVGTGFHPELTGRENIFLNGAILGMRKAEIESRFDEIVAFAELEKFLGTAVKHYSSGMYMRLAFAVAAHLNPEILIVDEVLAVGDTAFQRKCIGKMHEVSAGGRTVLFVSHNLTAVENLCQRGIVLDQGKVVFRGLAKEAVHKYNHSLFGGSTSGGHTFDLSQATSRKSRLGKLLKRIELYTDGDVLVSAGVVMGSSLTIRIYFDLKSPASSIDMGLGFDDLLQQRIFTAHTCFEPSHLPEKREGPQVFLCKIPSFTLMPGDYTIRVWLDLGNEEADLIDDAARITVLESDYYGTGKCPWNGYFVLKQHWQLQGDDQQAGTRPD